MAEDIGCLKLSVIHIGEICSISLDEFVFSKSMFHFMTMVIISYFLICLCHISLPSNAFCCT